MINLIYIISAFGIGLMVGAVATMYMVRKVMREKGMDYDAFISREGMD